LNNKSIHKNSDPPVRLNYFSKTTTSSNLVHMVNVYIVNTAKLNKSATNIE
ncbi:hypothetical protein HHI36_005228, partial [Cryptolaemus montrouzieri]